MKIRKLCLFALISFGVPLAFNCAFYEDCMYQEIGGCCCVHLFLLVLINSAWLLFVIGFAWMELLWYYSSSSCLAPKKIRSLKRFALCWEGIVQWTIHRRRVYPIYPRFLDTDQTGAKPYRGEHVPQPGRTG